jgi:hypothetical protein
MLCINLITWLVSSFKRVYGLRRVGQIGCYLIFNLLESFSTAYQRNYDKSSQMNPEYLNGILIVWSVYAQHESSRIGNFSFPYSSRESNQGPSCGQIIKLPLSHRRVYGSMVVGSSVHPGRIRSMSSRLLNIRFELDKDIGMIGLCFQMIKHLIKGIIPTGCRVMSWKRKSLLD